MKSTQYHTRLAARGADKAMHAALYLAGFVYPNINYSQPEMWESNDPAIILLRERYQFLADYLDYAYTLEGQNI